RNSQTRLNVIDTLSAGFSTANRRLGILAIPVAVDVFLWLGPKVVPGPSMTQLLEHSLPSQYVASTAGLQQLVAGFNLFSVLVLYIPSLIVRLGSIGPLASAAPVAAVNSAGMFALAAVGVGLLGLWLGCLYMGLMAQVIRDGRTNLAALALSVWRYWRRVVLFLLLVAAVLGASAVPLGLAYIVLAALNPAAGEFLALLVEIALVWALIYLYFAVQAVILSDVGPVRGIRCSMLVISHNFWASLLFMALSFLITMGLPIIWQLLAGSPPGLIIGIVGNAYIGTGVAAAGFLFLQDRLERVQQAPRVQTAKEIE
ncbi:MAG: hypothetical protein ACRDF8_04755, partial [Chloroflexota bacterium]